MPGHLIILAAATLVLACSSSKQDIAYNEVWVNEVTTKSISDHEVKLTVACTTPNPCYSFARFETEQISVDTTEVHIIGQFPTDMMCAAVLDSFTTDIEVMVEESGEHLFTFRTMEDEPLVHTVDIP